MYGKPILKSLKCILDLLFNDHVDNVKFFGSNQKREQWVCRHVYGNNEIAILWEKKNQTIHITRNVIK